MERNAGGVAYIRDGWVLFDVTIGNAGLTSITSGRLGRKASLLPPSPARKACPSAPNSTSCCGCLLPCGLYPGLCPCPCPCCFLVSFRSESCGCSPCRAVWVFTQVGINLFFVCTYIDQSIRSRAPAPTDFINGSTSPRVQILTCLRTWGRPPPSCSSRPATRDGSASLCRDRTLVSGVEGMDTLWWAVARALVNFWARPKVGAPPTPPATASEWGTITQSPRAPQPRQAEPVKSGGPLTSIGSALRR